MCKDELQELTAWKQCMNVLRYLLTVFYLKITVESDSYLSHDIGGSLCSPCYIIRIIPLWYRKYKITETI